MCGCVCVCVCVCMQVFMYVFVHVRVFVVCVHICRFDYQGLFPRCLGTNLDHRPDHLVVVEFEWT